MAPVLAWSGAAVVAGAVALRLLSLRRRDASVTNPAWGPVFALVA